MSDDFQQGAKMKQHINQTFPVANPETTEVMELRVESWRMDGQQIQVPADGKSWVVSLDADDKRWGVRPSATPDHLD